MCHPDRSEPTPSPTSLGEVVGLRSGGISLRLIVYPESPEGRKPLRFSSPALGNHTNRSLRAPPFHPILTQLFLQTTPAQTPLHLSRRHHRHRPVRQFRAPAPALRLTTHRRITPRTSRFHRHDYPPFPRPRNKMPAHLSRRHF
jgi:hypothetical protein